MDSLLNINNLNNIDPIGVGLGMLKLLYLAAFGLYVAFSIVVVSQIKQMTSALNGLLELPLRLFSWLHFILAVIAFLLAVVIL